MIEQQYPEWQKVIRQAQVKQNATDEAREIKEAEIKRLADEQHGHNLARVLEVAFGIKVEPPATNQVEMDGYHFFLKTYRGYSDWDDRLPTFSETKGEPPFIPTISFTVYVGIKQPEDMEELENWPSSVAFSETNSRIDADWTVMRAQLANTLDSLRESADSRVKQYKARLTHQTLNPPQPKPKRVTIEDLIKIIIEDKVAEIADARMGDF